MDLYDFSREGNARTNCIKRKSFYVEVWGDGIYSHCVCSRDNAARMPSSTITGCIKIETRKTERTTHLGTKEIERANEETNETGQCARTKEESTFSEKEEAKIDSSPSAEEEDKIMKWSQKERKTNAKANFKSSDKKDNGFIKLIRKWWAKTVWHLIETSSILLERNILTVKKFSF